MWRLQIAPPSLLYHWISHALLRNTCATTCFTVSVQNTWIYGCCGNYNWISWLWCRQKSLHRVIWFSWEWGRAVEHWAQSGGWCCVPAESRIGLWWFCPASMPSRHAVFWSQVLLAASLLLQEHCYPRGSSSPGRWITARSFAFDGNQRWKNYHWAKTSSCISWQCLFLENSVCWITVQLYTEIWRTWLKDPSEKCLLASAGWVASGKNQKRSKILTL